MSCDYFQYSSGERIAYKIDKNETTRDLVILAHGMFSDKDNQPFLLISSVLVTRFNVLRFDFIGNGESDGEFAYGNYDSEADQLGEVVQMAREKGFYFHIFFIIHFFTLQYMIMLTAYFSFFPTLQFFILFFFFNLLLFIYSINIIDILNF